jgi:hypothetical protein
MQGWTRVPYEDLPGANLGTQSGPSRREDTWDLMKGGQPDNGTAGLLLPGIEISTVLTMPRAGSYDSDWTFQDSRSC